MSSCYHCDHLPAKPFAERLRREESVRGAEALSADLKVNIRTIWRFKNMVDGDGNPTDSFPRDLIENNLHLLGLHLWDLYPDLTGDDAEVVEGYCTVCRENVGIDEEQRCLWCGSPASRPSSRRERAIRRGTVCPQCGGPKSNNGALICRACFGKPIPPDNTQKTQEPCPLCGGPKPNPRAMRCVKCFRANHLDTGVRRPNGLERLTEEELELGWELYEEHGFSVREVVEILEPDYPTAHCAEHSIIMAWRARGKTMRTPGESKRIAEARKRYMKLPTGNRSGSIGRAKAR